MAQSNHRAFILLSSLLLITEAGLLSLLVDVKTMADGELSWLLSNMGRILRWGLVSVFFFLLLLYFDKSNSDLKTTKVKSYSWLRLIIHLVTFCVFLPLTLIVFHIEKSTNVLLGLLWLLNAFVVLLSWCYLIWDLSTLKNYLLNQSDKVITAGFGAAIVLVLHYLSFDLWYYLSTIALYGSGILLTLFNDSVVIDDINNYLGINNFVVEIAPQCSGLEGLVISVCTTSIFLFLVRKDLKFPLALILIPVAAVISILFNIIRITALIVLGEYVSANLAVGGFHSVAGWLAAIIIAFLIIFVFSNWSFLRKDSVNKEYEEQPTMGNNDSHLAWAALVPFILFLLTTLFLQIFEFSFDYLYGIKVIIAGSVVLYFWQRYQISIPKKWLEPISAGAIIALLWYFLSPYAPESDAAFAEHLFGMSNLMMIGWILLRLIGSWVLIPVIEELIFRGYILARLSKQPFETNGTIAFSWLALLGSSALFALIHQALIAGFVAGIIFAMVRYRSQSITEVIVAHSVANIFVTFIALASGEWSLL